MATTGFWSRVREGRLGRVLLVYLAAAWVVLQATALLRSELELPRWVTPIAVLLLFIGLIIICATAWVQSHPLAASRAAREEIPSSWEIDLGDVKDSVVRGRIPHLTWGRSALGGVLAFSLLFGLAGLYVVLKDRGRSFAPESAIAGSAGPGLAVLPFAVRSADLGVWREGMVDLLSTSLDGLAGLRTIDSRTVLARWSEHVGSGASPDLETTLQIARSTGARYALVGSAVPVGRDVQLAADVYDLKTGAKLGQAQAQGLPDSLVALVNRLSIETARTILDRGEGDLPRIDLAHVTTTSLAALKAFLEGEVFFRRSQFDPAIAAYERAVEADSTFALALYRLGLAYGWNESILSQRSVEYFERAARHGSRLPERERTFAVAQLALERGTLDGVEPMRRAVAKYPDDSEAWYLLGENYHHLWSQALIPQNASDRVFEKAIELDPSFTPAYIHLVDNAFLRADSARAAELIAVYERLAPGTRSARDFQRAFALAFGDSAAHRRARAEVDSLPPRLVFAITLLHPRFRAVFEELLGDIAARSTSPALGGAGARAVLGWSLLGRGKLRRALAVAENPETPPAVAREIVSTVGSFGLPLPASIAERELAWGDSGPVDTLAPARRYFLERSLFYTGAYAAEKARWADHSAAMSRLRESAGQHLAAGDSASARIAQALARGLEGHRAGAEGRLEEGVRLLREAQQQATGHGGMDGLNSVLRARIAMLLLELGRHKEAKPYFQSFWPMPLASYHLGRIHEELGEFDDARSEYEFFVTYWKDADPELQPRVEEARAALQRLTSVIRE